jgi:protein associated with RNAse G/E
MTSSVDRLLAALAALKEIQNRTPPEPIKSGTYIVTLEGKSWGKKNNLWCYFTDLESGREFQVSMFRHRKTGIYTSRESSIDFAEKGIEGNQYVLDIKTSEKGFSNALSATLLKEV